MPGRFGICRIGADLPGRNQKTLPGRQVVDFLFSVKCAAAVKDIVKQPVIPYRRAERMARGAVLFPAVVQIQSTVDGMNRFHGFLTSEASEAG